MAGHLAEEDMFAHIGDEHDSEQTAIEEKEYQTEQGREEEENIVERFLNDILSPDQQISTQGDQNVQNPIIPNKRDIKTQEEDNNDNNDNDKDNFPMHLNNSTEPQLFELSEFYGMRTPEHEIFDNNSNDKNIESDKHIQYPINHEEDENLNNTSLPVTTGPFSSFDPMFSDTERYVEYVQNVQFSNPNQHEPLIPDKKHEEENEEPKPNNENKPKKQSRKRNNNNSQPSDEQKKTKMEETQAPKFDFEENLKSYLNQLEDNTLINDQIFEYIVGLTRNAKSEEFNNLTIYFNQECANEIYYKHFFVLEFLYRLYKNKDDELINLLDTKLPRLNKLKGDNYEKSYLGLLSETEDIIKKSMDQKVQSKFWPNIYKKHANFLKVMILDYLYKFRNNIKFSKNDELLDNTNFTLDLLNSDRILIPYNYTYDIYIQTSIENIKDIDSIPSGFSDNSSQIISILLKNVMMKMENEPNKNKPKKDLKGKGKMIDKTLISKSVSNLSNVYVYKTEFIKIANGILKLSFTKQAFQFKVL